jgi:uncharacterized membrane protein
VAPLWAFAILLSIIGITAAAARAYTVSTAHGIQLQASMPRTLAPLDSIASEIVIKTQGWKRPEERASYIAFIHSFADRWDDHPRYSMLHLIPGVLMLLLMPLQFVRRIRERHIRLHRWSGRAILVLGAGVAISAFYFGIRIPFVPRVEAFIITLIDGTFVYSITRGFLAIRRKDVEAHRRWMIRAYAVVAAVATVRLVALPLGLLYRTPEQASAALMASFVVGWLLTLGGAEWWLRQSPTAPA